MLFTLKVVLGRLGDKAESNINSRAGRKTSSGTFFVWNLLICRDISLLVKF